MQVQHQQHRHSRVRVKGEFTALTLMRPDVFMNGLTITATAVTTATTSCHLRVRVEGEITALAFMRPDVFMNGLDVTFKKSRLAERPTAFVTLILALFLVHRPHVHAHIVLARESFIAMRARKHGTRDLFDTCFCSLCVDRVAQK